MTHPVGRLGKPLPDIEIVDEEPPPGLAAAAEEALADVEAGRSVVCMSDDAFEALLDELARPATS
jgi:hypothetical protein